MVQCDVGYNKPVSGDAYDLDGPWSVSLLFSIGYEVSI